MHESESRGLVLSEKEMEMHREASLERVRDQLTQRYQMSADEIQHFRPLLENLEVDESLPIILGNYYQKADQDSAAASRVIYIFRNNYSSYEIVEEKIQTDMPEERTIN